MENKFKLKQQGISLEILDISDALRKDLKQYGHNTIDSIFAAMVVVPAAYTTYFATFGENYNNLYERMGKLLGPERVAELQPKTTEYSMGVLHPVKK